MTSCARASGGRSATEIRAGSCQRAISGEIHPVTVAARRPMLGRALFEQVLRIRELIWMIGTALAAPFPTNVRYTGSGIAYNTASILGAAVAPFIAVYLAKNYGVGWVGIYPNLMFEVYSGLRVLSVSGACCGLAGMVRYDGGAAASVGAAHPEVVGPGRVQAWVTGSGGGAAAGAARGCAATGWTRPVPLAAGSVRLWA